MEPYKLFNCIKNANYTTSGLKLDWCIKVDDENKIIYLLFQKTVGCFDWLMNLDFPVVPYKQQENTFKLHRGWVKVWKSANDIVMGNFIDVCKVYPDYQPNIAGWSYGGAMAQIAAEDYFYRASKIDAINIKKPDLTTFGSPKPLYGKSTRDYFKSCINVSKQYTHVNDLICLQPPFADYYRVSTEYIGSDKSTLDLLNPWKYHTIYGDESLYK